MGVSTAFSGREPAIQLDMYLLLSGGWLPPLMLSAIDMPSDLKSDWRLTNQAKYLTGVTLRLSRFHVALDKPEWDHEHCEFCWAKIVEKIVKSPTTIYWSRHMLQKIAFDGCAQSALKTSVRCSNGRSLHEMAGEPSACTGLRGPSSLHSGLPWRGASDAGALDNHTKQWRG